MSPNIPTKTLDLLVDDVIEREVDDWIESKEREAVQESFEFEEDQ